jgi:septal ring-binding cell division protein DamX
MDGDRYRRGLETFRSGDLRGAAAIWEALLAEDRRDGFTVQLQTACQPESIRKIQRALEPREILLVGKKVNGRECYRVCLGSFGSRESAAAALAGLPGEFKSSGAMVRAIGDVLTKDR